MRAGECAALDVDDININQGLATIRRGKGGKGRIVPFGAQTGQALDRYLRLRRRTAHADEAGLWVGPRGVMGYKGLAQALAVRAEVAGLKGFHAHQLRHTMASRWLRARGSEGGLMSVAGWSDRTMLDRYARATAAERAAEEAQALRLGDL